MTNFEILIFGYNLTMTPSYDIFRQLSQFSEPELQEEMIGHCQLTNFEKGDTIVRGTICKDPADRCIGRAPGLPDKSRKRNIALLCRAFPNLHDVFVGLFF
jgi:hypothetical protein